MPEDIEGSMAYAEALEQAGVLSPQELRRILEGLGEIRERAQRDPDFLAKAEDEDVHSFVEARLVEIIGSSGAETPHRTKSKRPGGGGYPALSQKGHRPGAESSQGD